MISAMATPKQNTVDEYDLPLLLSLFGVDFGETYDILPGTLIVVFTTDIDFPCEFSM